MVFLLVVSIQQLNPVAACASPDVKIRKTTGKFRIRVGFPNLTSGIGHDPKMMTKCQIQSTWSMIEFSRSRR